jgi:hypothetical protein
MVPVGRAEFLSTDEGRRPPLNGAGLIESATVLIGSCISQPNRAVNDPSCFQLKMPVDAPVELSSEILRYQRLKQRALHRQSANVH